MYGVLFRNSSSFDNHFTFFPWLVKKFNFLPAFNCTTWQWQLYHQWYVYHNLRTAAIGHSRRLSNCPERCFLFLLETSESKAEPHPVNKSRRNLLITRFIFRNDVLNPHFEFLQHYPTNIML